MSLRGLAAVAAFIGLVVACSPTSVATIPVGGPKETVAGIFAQTGPMAIPRYGQVATQLANGTALVAGGADFAPSGTTTLATAELFDPRTNRFTQTGPMGTARYGATATLLRDGRVLVVGGNDSPTATVSFASAELFDPVSGKFTPTGSMERGRARQTATLLDDGRVLVTGGVELLNGADTSLATAEIFDPSTGKFSLTGPMSTPRSFQTAVLLSNGLVLVAGGGGAITSHASAELFNPATGTFAPTGFLVEPLYEAGSVLLANGKALVVGGAVDATPLASAELYDPTSATFTQTGSMAVPRTYPSVTLLQDGLVLIIGADPDHPSDIAELYDPTTGTFSETGPLATQRSLSSAVMLGDGDVLVVGGGFDAATGFGTTSAELFR